MNVFDYSSLPYDFLNRCRRCFERRCILTVLSITVVVALSSTATAQNAIIRAIPVGPDIGAKMDRSSVGLLPGTSNDSFECATPPTPEEVRQARFSTMLTTLTASEAAALQVSFSGSAAGGFDGNQQVVVSQTGRWKPCLAKDGQTRLLYGHLVRTTVVLSGQEIEGEINFAVIAAQTTIKRASNRVELEAIGISDEEVQSKLLQAKSSLGGLELKVENFQDFDRLRSQAEAAAVKSDQIGAELVGIVGELASEADFRVLLAQAFALQSIAHGHDCDRAMQRFGATNAGEKAAMEDIYSRIAKGCQTNVVSRALAKQLLGGISIRK